MIDIHCHILPGIDDGPGTLNDALEMCRAAAADGIRTIVATPHFRPGTFEFPGGKVLDAVSTLSDAAGDEGLDLRILPGAEVTVSADMPAQLRQGRHLTLNHNGRYFLAELPPLGAPPNWDGFLSSLLSLGYVPIIAHPERNGWFMSHPEAIASAVGRGILVQITAMSVVGGFGPEVQDFSVFLLRHNLVHAIATDAHSADFRLPVLSEAVRLAAGLVGKDRAGAMVKSVPEAIISGRDVPSTDAAASAPAGGGRRRAWFRRLFR